MNMLIKFLFVISIVNVYAYIYIYEFGNHHLSIISNKTIYDYKDNNNFDNCSYNLIPTNKIINIFTSSTYIY